jgi:hypothetical protein
MIKVKSENGKQLILTIVQVRKMFKPENIQF